MYMGMCIMACGWMYVDKYQCDCHFHHKSFNENFGHKTISSQGCRVGVMPESLDSDGLAPSYSFQYSAYAMCAVETQTSGFKTIRI